MVKSDGNDKSEELKKLGQNLADQVIDIAHKMEIWRFLMTAETQEAVEIKQSITKVHNRFFGYLERSVNDVIVIGLGKLMADNNDEMSIVKYLNKTEQELRKCLSKELKEEIEARHNEVRELREKSNVLSRRNKTAAHNAPKYFHNSELVNDDFPISTDQIDKTIEKFKEILDWHRKVVLKANTYEWFEGIGQRSVENLFRELEMVEGLKMKHPFIYFELRKAIKGRNRM